MDKLVMYGRNGERKRSLCYLLLPAAPSGSFDMHNKHNVLDDDTAGWALLQTILQCIC